MDKTVKVPQVSCLSSVAQGLRVLTHSNRTSDSDLHTLAVLCSLRTLNSGSLYTLSKCKEFKLADEYGTRQIEGSSGKKGYLPVLLRRQLSIPKAKAWRDSP